MLETFESERFNWDTKLERTKRRIKLMLSASPSLVFSHKVHKIRFEKQIRILSYLKLIELGPPVSQSSTWISKSYGLTDSEHKCYKRKIENWLFIGFELKSPRLVTYSHNHYTMFNLQYDGES